MVPGAPAADAPVRGPAGEWLLEYLGGDTFTLLAFAPGPGREAAMALQEARVPCRVVNVAAAPVEPSSVVIEDREGLVAARYDGRPGTVVLLRPDQHVCARWRRFDPASVRAAIARATANG
jgi:3-(3-hydroxy-phenyl)propionate hydroxylase